MNFKNILICVLSLLLLSSIGFIVFENNKQSGSKEDIVFQNILSRKSVRDYDTSKTVSDDMVEKMLKAGMAAPSARNMQPWEFVVIKDKNTLESIASKINTAVMLKNASCAIAVLGNMEKAQEMEIFWQQDTSASAENILLEAEALGLGAVWIGVYPISERVNIIKNELNLPDNVLPLNIISIGYPKGINEPKDKWKTENIHYEKY